MRYTYTTYDANMVRKDVSVGHAPLMIYEGGYIEVYDNEKNTIVATLRDQIDLEGWQTKLERDYAWKPLKKSEPLIGLGEPEPFTAAIDEKLWGADYKDGKHTDIRYTNPCNEISLKIEQAAQEHKDHINPAHYKDIVPNMQFAEMMQHMLKQCKDPFEGAMLYCTFKYLVRNGKKDDMLQEYKKAKWYLDYIIAYMSNGRKPIHVADVRQILRKEGCE
jgi:hypothetical protein